jgi:hypothetical protein
MQNQREIETILIHEAFKASSLREVAFSGASCDRSSVLRDKVQAPSAAKCFRKVKVVAPNRLGEHSASAKNDSRRRESGSSVWGYGRHGMGICVGSTFVNPDFGIQPH